MKGFLRFFIYIFATWLFGCYNYVPTTAPVYFELPLIALLLGSAAPVPEVHCCFFTSLYSFHLCGVLRPSHVCLPLQKKQGYCLHACMCFFHF